MTGSTNQTVAERWAAAKLSSSQIPTQGSDKMLVVELPEPKLESLSSSATPVQDVPPSAETLSAVIANKPFPSFSCAAHLGCQDKAWPGSQRVLKHRHMSRKHVWACGRVAGEAGKLGSWEVGQEISRDRVIPR